MGSCTLLNVTGDVTISWDDENSSDVKKWIESKLKEGCTFFIIEKKLGFISKKKKVSEASSLPSKGSVKLSDDDAKSFFKTETSPMIAKERKQSNNNLKLGDFGAEKLLESGSAIASPKEKSISNKVKKVTNEINEIMSNDTMCTRRMVGG